MKIHIIMDEFKFTGQYDISDKHFGKVHELFLKMSKDLEQSESKDG